MQESHAVSAAFEPNVTAHGADCAGMYCGFEFRFHATPLKTMREQFALHILQCAMLRETESLTNNCTTFKIVPNLSLPASIGESHSPRAVGILS
jgi:hypothetical protein